MDDAYVVVYRGDGMEELSYVERAALWAAIESALSDAYGLGEANGRGDDDVSLDERAYAVGVNRLRELLGMEAES